MNEKKKESGMWAFTDRYAPPASRSKVRESQQEYAERRLEEYEGVRGAKFAVAEDAGALRLDECDDDENAF